MISIRQMKAARALLGWTQTQLAKASGLHLNAVSKIEGEQVLPRQDTLSRIQSCFEAKGVKFRGQRGLELVEETFELARFEGQEAFRKLVDDITISVVGPGEEVLNCLTSEFLFEHSGPVQTRRYFDHLKKTKTTERYLTDITQTRFRSAKKIYRGLPAAVLGTISFVLYANRVAFINWKNFEMLVIKNNSLAATYKAQFEFMWQQAKPFK